MKSDLTPEELLTTTRAVRKRLDLTRPVELEVIRECVEIAVQAPSGSNLQPYIFFVVTDAEKRRALADIYREAFGVYKSSAIPQIQRSFEADGRGREIQRINSSSEYLAAHLHEVPVHVIPCLQASLASPMTPARLEHAPNFLTAPAWASVLPAVWSFMLAARERGLGTSLTTLHLVKEYEAAQLLGIPYEQITQIALIPVAYTTGTTFKPAARKQVRDVFRVNSW